METLALRWISDEQIYARLSFGDAARAVQHALANGLDPASDPPRGVVDVTSGQLLLMPSEGSGYVGVKIASVAPSNPSLGRQRIQGIYTVFDQATLTPVAHLDGVALTTLRTPAVSAAAADLLAPERVGHLVVFGSGPQAWGHIQAFRAFRTIGHVTIVARDSERATALARRVSKNGLDASVGTPDAARKADVIVCATTARSALFDDVVRDDVLIVAVGSHEPDARELAGALVARSQVVVEDVATALREAGDIVLPIADGLLEPEALVPLGAIVTGKVSVDRSRPRVFKSVGMSWEDLVVAAAVIRADEYP